MHYWYVWKKTEMLDNIERIIVYTDELEIMKQFKQRPFARKYSSDREHKLIEIGYAVKKNSDEHKWLKEKFKLRLKDRWEPDKN